MIRPFTTVLTAAILLSILTLSMYAGVQGQAATTPCVQNVTFLLFVPCWQETDGIHRSAALERLDDCDLLARAAVSLAIERVNENRDILVPSYLRTVPLFPELNETISLQIVTDAFRFVHSNEYFGVIGPSDPAVAAFWAPIFQRSNLMMISYDITSTEPDRTFTFYRSLPSNHAANIGRLSLITRFEWFRIATITSQERFYAQMGEDFISLFNQKYKEGRLWTITLTHSPDSALEEVWSRDINIIFGFFDSDIAREILCRAKLLFAGLVSNDHAWILPSYYNPNWWKLPAGMDSECSDEDMKVILESVIFIDTVKYPPMDLPLNEFHSQLMAKTLDLFPSLTEEDLKPYLLHSRATNAYDAVTLLARSVGVAFEQGGDNWTDINVIQVAFEKVFMKCEYCRLNSGCFLNETETRKCQDLCGPDYRFDPAWFSQSYPDLGSRLRSDHLLNYYGQVSYSQFTGGEECIVGLLWNGGNGSDIRGHIYTLEEDIEEASCALQHNLSHTLRNFISNSTQCPMTFQWKGSSGPPPSRHLLVYEVPPYQMIIIGVLTGIGLVITVAFLIFNIVWRKNKVVKASSPWLNIIIIVGILIRLPVPLMDGLSLSSRKYGFDANHMYPLCHLIFLNHYVGDVIFISALLMKNWRLYCIFNNKEMKLIGKRLNDRWLLLGILLCSLPTAVTLMVGFSFNLRLQVVLFPNEKLQLEEFSFCDLENVGAGWGIEVVLVVYSAVLLFLLLGISFLTSVVHSPTFRHEAVLSLRAVTVALVPLSTLYIVFIFLRIPQSFKLDRLRWIIWTRFMMNVCLPIVITLILFGPCVYVIIKRYAKEKRGEQKSELINHYRQLLKQKEDLKMQLSQIEKMKTDFLAERLKQSETSSDGNHTYKSMTDAIHSSMETECNYLKTSTVNPIDLSLVTAEDSKDPQHKETSFTSSQGHDVDESIRTLYAIVSSPAEQYEHTESIGHTDDSIQVNGDTLSTSTQNKLVSHEEKRTGSEGFQLAEFECR